MYNDTVTLFNYYGDEWYATVLRGVDFNADVAKIREKYGEASADRATLHIRYEGCKNLSFVAGKPYLPPRTWKAPDTERARSITFKSGNDFDFFVLGEWDGSTTICDSDYTGGFFEDCRRKYDDVYVIDNVVQYTVIPHFEITAK